MNETQLKISFIISVLHLKRPLNKARFFVPRYTLPDVLRDLHENVTLPHELIVVCNGQDKELVDFVTSHPHIDKYCLNSVNVGVARSWNMGAEMAEGEALCFVNDDVEIGKGGAEGLFDVLTGADDVGQVGPMGALWNGAEHVRYVGESEIEEANAISGFLFMLHEKAFRQVGGFDPAYSPAGFEKNRYELCPAKTWLEMPRRARPGCQVPPSSWGEQLSQSGCVPWQGSRHHRTARVQQGINFTRKWVITDAR